MALSDSLPSDSVLRRHALTERNRILGLPPTDLPNSMTRPVCLVNGALRRTKKPQSRPVR